MNEYVMFIFLFLVIWKEIFSTGSYDKCVHQLRDANKDNMAAVSPAIFSHAQVSKKNLLVPALIVRFLEITCSTDFTELFYLGSI